MRLAARQLGKPSRSRTIPERRKDARARISGEESEWPRAVLELDDGRCLPESGAILWFLTTAAIFSPLTIGAKRKLYSGCSSNSTAMSPMSRRPVLARLRTQGGARAEARPRSRMAHARQCALSVMETHLTHNDWFAGGAYSLADIALYGYTHCADEGGFELSRYGAVYRLVETRRRAAPSCAAGRKLVIS